MARGGSRVDRVSGTRIRAPACPADWISHCVGEMKKRAKETSGTAEIVRSRTTDGVFTWKENQKLWRHLPAIKKEVHKRSFCIDRVSNGNLTHFIQFRRYKSNFSAKCATILIAFFNDSDLFVTCLVSCAHEQNQILIVAIFDIGIYVRKKDRARVYAISKTYDFKAQMSMTLNSVSRLCMMTCMKFSSKIRIVSNTSLETCAEEQRSTKCVSLLYFSWPGNFILQISWIRIARTLNKVTRDSRRADRQANQVRRLSLGIDENRSNVEPLEGWIFHCCRQSTLFSTQRSLVLEASKVRTFLRECLAGVIPSHLPISSRIPTRWSWTLRRRWDDWTRLYELKHALL